MSSSWQLHTVLLLVLLFHSSEQVQEECVVQQQNGSCPPLYNYKSPPLTIIQSSILQKLSSIQLDLTIIQSELSCRLNSNLLNATRSTINHVIATDFRELFTCHGETTVCCSKHNSKPTICNCNNLLNKCLGPTGVKFLSFSWREVVDNVRTSLRILLSEESNRCSLPSSSNYLSKLHSSRDLQSWVQCGGSAQNCLQVHFTMATTATASGSQQQLTSLLTTSSEKLKLYWPTTTAVVGSDGNSFVSDELESGSGFQHPRLLRQHHSNSQNDQDFGGSGAIIDGMITDDEDLLSGSSDFGSGDSTDESTEKPPPPKETIVVVTTTTTTKKTSSKASQQQQLILSITLLLSSLVLICR